MPRVYLETMLPFLHYGISQDRLHELIEICYSENPCQQKLNIDRTRKKIRAVLNEQYRKNRILYSKRNISLNQTLGDSDTPVEGWLLVDLNWWYLS